MSDAFARTVAFLTDIGIKVRIGDTTGGFLPGIRVENGSLIVTPETPVSNILHEAGHLAIIPAQFRHLASGDLSAVEEAICETIPNEQVDSWLSRACMQTSDTEATAWAWAAGVHIGLKPKQIIRDDEYDGEGADIRAMVSTGHYFGVHGLRHAGFCETRGPACYPKLRYWLQPDIPPTRLDVAAA